MISDTLAGFVCDLSFENIPAEVVQKTKQTILDVIGNSLGAVSSEEGEQIYRIAETETSPAEAFVFGGGKSSLEKAVMVNAVMSRIADLDDGHKFSTGHPSTVVVPTALTCGQVLGSSGREIIRAIIAGYEVYVRIARGINVSAHKEKGYDMTGVCGSVAAAMVAGVLMGFDREKLVDAMGIAGSFTGGLYECLFDGSSPKILVPGWAARTGVTAAKMAAAGFTGPASIVEGKKGIAQGVTNHYDLTHVLDELGARFEICGTYFKKYACMRGLHGAVDAVLELQQEHGFAAEDVKKVTILTSKFVKQYDKPFPGTVVATQSNLPYNLAVGMLYSKIGMDEVQRGLSDPQIRDLASRVEVVLDPEMEAYVSAHFDNLTAAKAVVRTKEGCYKKTVYLACGEPEKPLSTREMEDKYYFLAEKAVSRSQADRIRTMVLDLEDQEDGLPALVALKYKKTQQH